VVDASAVVEFLLRTSTGRKLSPKLTDAGIDLHVPGLCDVEVVAALRGLERRGELEPARARAALDDYLDLPLVRHGQRGLVVRAFAQRENFSAHDAVYVALAEGLGSDFLTADDRLRSAVAERTEVELVAL